MSTMLHRLCHDDAGQDLVEYALLCSLLALISIASLRFLGGNRLAHVWFLTNRALQ